VKPVVIVGGGLSGLSAAVTLSSSSIPVTVLEQKPQPGGRAYSFRDGVTGEGIDNGQHVLIAGYTHTLKFLERIGTLDKLFIQPHLRLTYHHPRKGFHTVRFPALPSPFHLVWGILRYDLLPLVDRCRMLYAGLVMPRSGSVKEKSLEDLTVEEWLDSCRQTAACKATFWEPLAVSIMNERIATASARTFVRAVREAFLGHWRNASLALPRVGLSELYVEGAREFIQRHGGTVLCSSDVTEVLFDGTAVTGVRLRDGSSVACDALVLSVPPARLPDLLPAPLRDQPEFSAMQSVPPSPIVSIHLWFEQDFMEQEFVGLLGRRVQWVFNKRKMMGASRRDGHVSLVISAAHQFVGLSNEELIRIALEDLQSVYPFITAEPLRAVVIREKRATFSSTPAVERLRPSQRTSVPNLFLAGDWTDTGYPATIEGAVLSGERAAQLAKKWLGLD
jgi:squalene-associated FAD-dependent desaturase